jgi:hypothetical protein
MTKEFDLNNYQYTEDHITFDQFLGYRPIKNPFADDGSSFNGTLFLHQDEEWQHIVSLSAASLWTLYEEEGVIKIRNGYQVNGRLGYFHCEQMHNAHGTIVVTSGIPTAGLTQ